MVKIIKDKNVHLSDGRSISFKAGVTVEGEKAQIALEHKIGLKVKIETQTTKLKRN